MLSLLDFKRVGYPTTVEEEISSGYRLIVVLPGRLSILRSHQVLAARLPLSEDLFVRRPQLSHRRYMPLLLGPMRARASGPHAGGRGYELGGVPYGSQTAATPLSIGQSSAVDSEPLHLSLPDGARAWWWKAAWW